LASHRSPWLTPDWQLATAVAEAASVVVVSMGEASAAAVSMGEASAAVAFVVAVAAISVQCEADTRSRPVEFVRGAAATGVGATGTAIGAITITDSLMMSSSSATWAFRGGGAGTIRTDITVTTITRTIPMGTAGMDTVGTVTTISPVTDTAMAADQGIRGVCGIGDKRGLRCGQANRDHSAMIGSYFFGNTGQLLLI